MTTGVSLMAGDPAPWFRQRSFANPAYAIDTAGGRYIVLCLFGSAGDPHAAAAIAAAQSREGFFDDRTAVFFGISCDPHDESEKRVRNRMPGYRYIWDFDGAVCRLYGALPPAPKADGSSQALRRMWVVIDPAMRVLAVIPFTRDHGDISRLLAFIDALPPPERHAGFEVGAPILVLPNVFEPSFCQRLIAFYEAHGGQDSGFMREIDGKTVAVHDHAHKRRRDCTIEDGELVAASQARFARRVLPMVQRAYQFLATRMERYIVACYAAEDRAHFSPHRDNTTKGTAHRRFAVSVNLNDDFDGGEIRFPEFGPRSYRPPIGGAVVFSCSLLHAVSAVTRGRRYCFLPFLYDEEAARQREANRHLVLHPPRPAAAARIEGAVIPPAGDAAGLRTTVVPRSR